MGCLEIKGMRIGEGRPKIIISLMGGDAEACLPTIEAGRAAGVDCFELRADFLDAARDPEGLAAQTRAVAAALPENPLIFTLRTKGQGGALDLPADEYAALVRAVIEGGGADLVDIETWIGDAAVSGLVEAAHGRGAAVILSQHDFEGTPSQERMVQIMRRMLDAGADVPKLAVMAHDAADALALLSATEQLIRERPDALPLTMAMGREGSISRLTGEFFGSAMTFCSLERASAPGQVEVARARRVMDDLHGLLA